ncbi:hypothetical protein KC356_g165 [Hortaea werneckii]|nr:hypothetical protein KC356_g165 [Hortaea werneckii]
MTEKDKCIFHNGTVEEKASYLLWRPYPTVSGYHVWMYVPGSLCLGLFKRPWERHSYLPAFEFGVLVRPELLAEILVARVRGLELAPHVFEECEGQLLGVGFFGDGDVAEVIVEDVAVVAHVSACLKSAWCPAEGIGRWKRTALPGRDWPLKSELPSAPREARPAGSSQASRFLFLQPWLLLKFGLEGDLHDSRRVAWANNSGSDPPIRCKLVCVENPRLVSVTTADTNQYPILTEKASFNLTSWFSPLNNLQND